jgi:hypothetical protein
MNLDKEKQYWGDFRHFISDNPLTGFWSGVVLGFMIGFVVAVIF